METLLRFLQCYCAVVPRKYWALEKEEISNITFFIVLSFFLLWNIRLRYSKYFQNHIYETDISSSSE